MRSVVSVSEMTAFDRAALASTNQEILIRRAGMAVGFAVMELLEGVSGTRIAVIAGPGSNGNDGRVAAAMLRRRGASVTVVGVDAPTEAFTGVELVIDAAFGTGLSRAYTPPALPEGVRVVAVDLPSGLNGDTGELLGSPLAAELTVTMAAIKTGLILDHGPELAGRIVVADVGIPTIPSRGELVEESDLRAVPPRGFDVNKWSAAVCVVAGSPGMEGSASLCSLGALRAGSGMVRLVTVNEDGRSAYWPRDVVRREVVRAELVETSKLESTRSGAMVIGPGLGLDNETTSAIRDIVATRKCPVVLDADGITAARDKATLRELAQASSHPLMITPHDGELQRLLGHELGPDRVQTLTALADETGAIVLSKGATTVVAAPHELGSSLRFVTSGTSALATAGTGDVLSGVIAALCARGVPLALAGALGAYAHGRAGARAPGTMMASDLPALVGEFLREVAS